MATKLEVPIGSKFGRLTTISSPFKQKSAYNISATCECGKVKNYDIRLLRTGRTKSCGCWKADVSRLKAHGLRGKPIFKVWSNMKSRCLNSNTTQYKDYGGRGITVCEEWSKSVRSFANWAMANGYAEGLLIDRINNDGNYEPSNCRFVDRTTSNRNTRVVKLNKDKIFEIKRITKIFSNREIAEIYSVTHGYVSRIRNNHVWA